MSNVLLADIIAAMGWWVGMDRLDHDGEQYYWKGRPWDPQTDIAAAMDIVEALTREERPGQPLYFKLTYRWDDDYGCWAAFDWKETSDTHPLYRGHGTTMSEAIYAAACAVVTAEREIT